jgi:hypothetical protein
MPRVLFLFVDGVGLGPATSANPLAVDLPAFMHLARAQHWVADADPVDEPTHVFRPIDATLGVDGLPQSGTGQASLFTGVNCPALVGRHFGPFPHSATHSTLASENVFAKVKRHPDLPAPAFLNAYPPRFFEMVRERSRWTVTTRCCKEADVPVRGVSDLRAGRALTADLTGHRWEPLGHDIPTINEREAGTRFVSLAQDHSLTVFEYFLTDKAGHGRLNDEAPSDIVRALDRFLQGVLEALDLTRDLLVITSDHGNLEDGEDTTHTRNPVPLIAYGQGAHHFARAESITDVTPRIVRALTAT